jgi:hypothetical protein
MKKFHTDILVTLSVFAIIAVIGCDAVSNLQPEMPITPTIRYSAVGMGGVLQLENTSDAAITVDVHVEARQAQQKTDFKAIIPSYSTREYGWLELGWMFDNGETVYIRHPDYKTIRVDVLSGTYNVSK